MRPHKKMNQQISTAASKKGAITRSKNAANTSKSEGKESELPKRKAEGSPPNDKTLKRSAFGDITNARESNITSQDVKKLSKKIIVKKADPKGNEKANMKVTVTVPNKSTAIQPVLKTHTTLKKFPVSTKPKVVRQKNEEVSTKSGTSQVLEKEIKEDISVISEQQEINLSSKDNSGNSSFQNDGSNSHDEPQMLEFPILEQAPSPKASICKSSTTARLPEGVEDFDKETLNDPFQVSLYAMDIFNYLKEREVLFIVKNYMVRQPSISQWMRSLLVDWMVEVQESFELNHETLYLAVKLVDLYLDKIVVGKETLQLIGAAAMFIASKFDERIPPLVEDFLYICDGAYTHSELIKMETNLLKVVDFNLGIPLSYRFLRRYARCAKLSLSTLTLARYILESSLLEYSFVSESSSKMAAAALLLALKTKLLGGWTPTLQYYSGYKLEDIGHLAHQLNAMLHKKPKTALTTVRNKYSHKIFFEVAKIPLLENLDL
ncbi:G2/mitotic-specific cyclin-B3 isoform X2 [Cryptotermes secundus]|uniref:G2/mitotic-specific cyclin-B3 isoform X2 n=1 Tax=Cryptotermes secundus TaxID=105785 RepID=UPI000CD7AE9A|nr:G2/mitotic-specific cyclin-B3 isoform X2 [Cryptotermes secundus]